MASPTFLIGIQAGVRPIWCRIGLITGHFSVMMWGHPWHYFSRYFPNMKHVGFYNLTVCVANAALSILTRIHEAQILHYDFIPRNILVSPGGRVVIVCTAPYSYLPCLVSFIYDPRLILVKYTFIQPIRLLSVAQLAVLWTANILMHGISSSGIWWVPCTFMHMSYFSLHSYPIKRECLTIRTQKPSLANSGLQEMKSWVGW